MASAVSEKINRYMIACIFIEEQYMHIRQKSNALNTEKKSTLFQYLNDKYNALKKTQKYNQ